MNTAELEAALFAAERRVLEIQTKLHRWASDDPRRRFDDLYNLVTDPAFLLVAWGRVRSNKGARRLHDEHPWLGKLVEMSLRAGIESAGRRCPSP